MEAIYHSNISFIYYSPELYLLKKNRHHYKPRPYRRGDGETIRLPVKTHNWLHANFSNRELAELYGTKDKLIRLLEEYEMEY